MQGNLFDLSPEQQAHMNLLGMGDLVKTPTINLRRLLGHSIAKDSNYLKHDLVLDMKQNEIPFLISKLVELIICTFQVFIPTNLCNDKWCLMVINNRRREIHFHDGSEDEDNAVVVQE